MTSHERQCRVLLAGIFGFTGAMLIALLVLAWPFREHLPAFESIEDAGQRKSAFFRHLLPVVEAENRRLEDLRREVASLADRRAAGRPLNRHETRLLRALAERYRSPLSDPLAAGFFGSLLARADQVPASLVLAQAAMESGWGGSRFAREGLNLFGHWCEVPGCGMVPAQRPEGASYEVARFDSVRESVRKYMHNLNSHRAYRDFRARRAELRRRGERLSGPALARTLTSYSERGREYIDDIRALIAANDLVRCTRDPEVGC